MAIIFQNEDITFNLKQKIKIKHWIKNIVENNNLKLGSISYIFCSNNFILDINKQYLKHDYFTDIITFDYCNNNIVEGDIFISIDTVADNAKDFNVTFEEEIHRVIIHGILHLIGFDDKTEEAQKEMTFQENQALKLFETI